MTPTPAERLLRLLAGKWVSAAVSAAAELRLVEALGGGPRTADALADALDLDRDNLRRLLGVLAGEELLSVDESGRFLPTELGWELAGPLGDVARFVGSPAQWSPWSGLAEAVRTGHSAFESAHGVGLYRWLEAHPGDSQRYDHGVEGFTAEVAQAAAARPELGAVRRVVDVGGGLGTLLIALLQRWPHLQGTLLDRPHALERARPRIDAAGLGARTELYAADFFDPLPAGADLYVLQHVLHNWSDDEARSLLERCRDAVAEGGWVWVIETVLPPGTLRCLPRYLDLEMMVLFGRGRARTKPELLSLMRSAGLNPDRATHPLSGGSRLLMAKPRAGSPRTDRRR